MSGKAESRLIYSSISTSDRVSSLGAKGALLYTWLITHCDGQGRMPGKPKVVKHLVVPLIEDLNEADVAQLLTLMEKERLVILYEDDNGRPLIQIADWWDWQTGLKYRAPSHYQAPEGWVDRITNRDDNGRFVKE